MEYILTIMCVAMAGFVCLLLYYDLPPKAILFKIVGRFVTPPEFLRTPQPESPYQRIRSPREELHKPILLNLGTSDGSGQALHPDVVYVPGGFGENKWPYWMVCTPYPNGDEHFENPEIFVSRDGVTWSVPEGMSNPIVPAPKDYSSHHSDPDIVFHEDALWIVYRQTIRGESRRENVLYLIKSIDGIHWSNPLEILRDNQGAELLSPSLIHDGKSFVLWTVETHEGEFRIVRRKSADCKVWELSPKGSVSGIDQGRHPWHIDVLEETDRLSAILVSCTANNGAGSRLHYAYSLDHGLTWQVSPFLLQQAYEFESAIQYRGTLRRMEDSSDRYQLWYSAVSNKRISSIAYLQLVRRQNELFPL
jgi:hypothetical protein